VTQRQLMKATVASYAQHPHCNFSFPPLSPRPSSSLRAAMVSFTAASCSFPPPVSQAVLLIPSPKEAAASPVTPDGFTVRPGGSCLAVAPGKPGLGRVKQYSLASSKQGNSAHLHALRGCSTRSSPARLPAVTVCCARLHRNWVRSSSFSRAAGQCQRAKSALLAQFRPAVQPHA
jgi:hypothetical protein